MSVFVDTGAWFAYFVRRDPDHNLARKWVSNNDSQLITSDYILDEHFEQFGSIVRVPKI